MPTNPDPDLMRIFDFTAADLEANRAGRITEHQASQFHKRVNFEIAYLSIFIGALLIIFWFIVIKFVMVVPPNYDKFPMIAIFGVVPTVSFVCYFAFIKQRITSDIKMGNIDYIDGLVKVWSSKNYIYVSVSGNIFYFGLTTNLTILAALQTIPNSLPYRVYYAPKSKRVVSMEIISS